MESQSLISREEKNTVGIRKNEIELLWNVLNVKAKSSQPEV